VSAEDAGTLCHVLKPYNTETTEPLGRQTSGMSYTDEKPRTLL